MESGEELENCILGNYKVKMTGKSLETAKQLRDKLLLEFKALCYDLEEELSPPEGIAQNARKLRMKLNLLKVAYDDCLAAQSKVFGLEKTTGAEDTNWSWVIT